MCIRDSSNCAQIPLCTIGALHVCQVPLPRWVHLMYDYLMFMTAATNPLIYGFMNKSFRAEYFRIVRCNKRGGRARRLIICWWGAVTTVSFLAFIALFLQKLITRILDLTHLVLYYYFTTIFWIQVSPNYSQSGWARWLHYPSLVRHQLPKELLESWHDSYHNF